jgi:hypothetical protein
MYPEALLVPSNILLSQAAAAVVLGLAAAAVAVVFCITPHTQYQLLLVVIQSQ